MEHSDFMGRKVLQKDVSERVLVENMFPNCEGCSTSNSKLKAARTAKEKDSLEVFSCRTNRLPLTSTNPVTCVPWVSMWGRDVSEHGCDALTANKPTFKSLVFFLLSFLLHTSRASVSLGCSAMAKFALAGDRPGQRVWLCTCRNPFSQCLSWCLCFHVFLSHFHSVINQSRNTTHIPFTTHLLVLEE